MGRLLGGGWCTALWDLAYGILLLLGAVVISGYSVVTGSATVLGGRCQPPRPGGFTHLFSPALGGGLWPTLRLWRRF